MSRSNITKCNFSKRSVAVIFADLDLETLLGKIKNNAFLAKTFKFIKTNRLFVGLTSAGFAFVLAAVITVVATGLTLGFSIDYSGERIATVQKVSDFDKARDLVVKSVSGKEADKSIGNPKFALTLTVANKIDNIEKVADAIIANTNDIVEGSALIVNGEKMICTEAQGLSQMLEAKKTAFYIEGAENTASFVENVEIENGYYLRKDIEDVANAQAIVDGLQVKTVSTVVTNVSIPHKTKKVSTSKKPVGYYEVTVEGQSGVNRKTESVESINGQETSRVELSYEVITNVIDEVVTIGVAPNKVTAAQNAAVSSAGFICPLTKGKFQISAYYGDGRNHKGIDLAANKGVAIFAAASGTVVSSGWDGNYGYSIVIDHGNGLKTRYAHASALYVAKGTTVSQGEMIAGVGSTGYSTGNHLHFEVIVNGNRVNPAPYIGL